LSKDCGCDHIRVDELGCPLALVTPTCRTRVTGSAMAGNEAEI
jgi:hypothetical protein